LEAATFSNGDKVICAKWFDDIRRRRHAVGTVIG
jgi:hypothetical protein